MAQLSIVIPTLNAIEGLGPCLAALARFEAVGLVREVVIADGGSTDGTPAAAKEAGAAIVESAPGRGTQLGAGAAAARGDWLLFLHADTVLDEGWSEAVRRFIGEPANARRAAAFRLALDDEAAAARRVERLVGWRSRILALPYGDQGLLMPRALYDEVGGYRPWSLMEDVDIVRRIGRRRLTLLDVRAVTSAARYRRDGWWLRPARNLLCLGLYFLGAPKTLIRAAYG